MSRYRNQVSWTVEGAFQRIVASYHALLGLLLSLLKFNSCQGHYINKWRCLSAQIANYFVDVAFLPSVRGELRKRPIRWKHSVSGFS